MTDAAILKHEPALHDHREALRKKDLKSFFAADVNRFKKLSFALPGLLVDFSKNFVTDETISLLVALARDAGVAAQRDAMLSGEKTII